MTKKVEISPKTIALTLVFILIAAIIYIIRDLILLFFVAYIFFAALSPLISGLTNLKVPRVFAIILIILGLILFLSLFFFVGVLPVVSQFGSFVDSITAVLGRINETSFANFINVNFIESSLRNFIGNAANLIVSIFQNLLLVFTVVIFTIYLLIERVRYEQLISFAVGRPWKETIFARIEGKLGGWVRAQILAGLVVGSLYFIALTILGIPFAPSLAILGAVFELVPIFGPFLAAVPAVLLALAISPSRAILVGVAYFIIQEIEGHLVIPLVVGGTIGLDPLLVVLSVAFFGRLFGFGGVFLAVPITVVIQIILEEIILKNKQKLSSWFKL